MFIVENMVKNCFKIEVAVLKALINAHFLLHHFSRLSSCICLASQTVGQIHSWKDIIYRKVHAFSKENNCRVKNRNLKNLFSAKTLNLEKLRLVPGLVWIVPYFQR